MSDPELRNQIDRMAERITALEMQCPGGNSRSIVLDDDNLATIAASIAQARRRRAKLFDPSLFGEPAWDILLELFVCKVRGRRMSIANLSRVANVSAETGNRFVSLLGGKGLVRSAGAFIDGPPEHVELTERAMKLMRQYVSEGVTRFEMPMPVGAPGAGDGR